MELSWLVITDTNEDITMQFWLDKIGLRPLVEIQYQELHYKGWLSQQEHGAVLAFA